MGASHEETSGPSQSIGSARQRCWHIEESQRGPAVADFDDARTYFVVIWLNAASISLLGSYTLRRHRDMTSDFHG